MQVLKKTCYKKYFCWVWKMSQNTFVTHLSNGCFHYTFNWIFFQHKSVLDSDNFLGSDDCNRGRKRKIIKFLNILKAGGFSMNQGVGRDFLNTSLVYIIKANWNHVAFLRFSLIQINSTIIIPFSECST